MLKPIEVECVALEGIQDAGTIDTADIFALAIYFVVGLVAIALFHNLAGVVKVLSFRRCKRA